MTAARQPHASEDHIQHAVARVLDELGVLWCHVPNEALGDLPGSERRAPSGPKTLDERRRMLRATQLVGAGVKAGVPDVLVFTPPPALLAARGVAIEIKTIVNGPSAAQTRWLDGLRSDGWYATCERGFEAVMTCLGWLGWDVDGALARCAARGERWDGLRWVRGAVEAPVGAKVV